MTISLITRWVSKLIPERHKQAATQAETAAVQSRTVMRDVAARAHKVDRLMGDMATDLVENHFGERVAEAIGRNQP